MNNNIDNTIEKSAVSGIFWRFSEEILTKVVSFVVSIILARILVPEDYGLVSIASIVISIADMLIDSGLCAALIQKGNADTNDYSTVFTFSLVLSLLFYFIVFILSVRIANLYNIDDLSLVLRILCLIIVINTIKGIYFTYLSTTLQFKKIFFSSLFGTVCSVIIGISMAINGYGVWALVFQKLSDVLIDTFIMFFTTKLKLRLCFSYTRFKSLFNYSKNILVSNIFSYTYNTIVPIFVSLRFSVLDLSYYTKAKHLSDMIPCFIETPLSQVLFPVLSKTKENKTKLLEILRKFYLLLYFFTIPFLLGFYVVAEDFICILLTEKWLMIVPYMRIFVIGMLFNKNIQGIKAIGRSDLSMKAVIANRLFSLSCLVIAIFISNDPISVAYCYIPMRVSYFLIQIYLEYKYLGYSLIEQGKDMLVSLLLSVIMALCVYLIGNISYVVSLPLILRLGIKILSGIVVYIFLSIIFNSKTVRTLYGLRLHK